MRRREKNTRLMIRLDDYGKWVLQPIHGISYKNRTIEAVMMELGGIYNDGNACAAVPIYRPNKECAEISRIIDDMSPSWQKAIWAKHVVMLKDEEIKNGCGFTYQQCYKILKLAYPYMAGRLGLKWEH